MDSSTSTGPTWLNDLSAIAGIGLSIVREVRAPSPTTLPQGATGVQVGISRSGINLTTSPVLVVTAVAALVLVVWIVTKR